MFSQILSRLGSFSLGGGNAVGLSVGSSSIKIVELKKHKKVWRLLHFGMIQLPEGAIVNREISNPISVVESVRTLVSQLKLKTTPVCISISGTALIIKRMTIEIKNKRELQDQVFWEAEQYLPFDVSEVVMDYQVLSLSKQGTADILLVAAKKSVLESYMGVVNDAGLKPKIVDVDFFALQNLFEINYPASPNESVALVDIGAVGMKFVVVNNGIPVFTKDSAIGGRNLTLEIQKHLNLSYEDAEALKVGGRSKDVPQEVSELTNITCENIASEIKRALDFYNASSSGAPISYVLLAGGSSRLAGLVKAVEESLGLPTQLLNPFNNITYDSSVFTDDYIGSIASVAAIPIGLAMRMGN